MADVIGTFVYFVMFWSCGSNRKTADRAIAWFLIVFSNIRLLMEMQGREHIGWIDLLRVVACFLVVLSHCCDPFVARFDADRGAFLTGVFTGSFVRACVPLFVMMTGVLLLPVRAELGDFYRKRIGRIVVPLVFWSVVLPLSYFVYLNYVVSTGNPMIVADDHTLGATLTRIYTFIFNFNYDTTPLWYLYMLVGLYLIMPVIGAWLQQASRRDIRLVLYVWGVTLLLPYIKMVAPALGYTGNYGNMGILGVCDWNSYGTFYYVSGFIGYLILAYYLAKYPPQWSWKRTLAVTVPMFLGGYLITSFGYVLTQQYFPGDYAYLEIVWLFTGINVFMMTFAVFVVIRKLKVRASVGLSRLASLTFGIYLCHFIFVQVGYDLMGTLDALPVLLRIFCVALFAFGISCALVWIMFRFRPTRRFVR